MSDADGRSNRIVVLVVEDEPLVRALAVDVLEEAGFEVIEAPTADYALIVLERRSDISVIFTDVEMPGRLNASSSPGLSRTITKEFASLWARDVSALAPETSLPMPCSWRNRTPQMLW